MTLPAGVREPPTETQLFGFCENDVKASRACFCSELERLSHLSEVRGTLPGLVLQQLNRLMLLCFCVDHANLPAGLGNGFTSNC